MEFEYGGSYVFDEVSVDGEGWVNGGLVTAGTSSSVSAVRRVWVSIDKFSRLLCVAKAQFNGTGMINVEFSFGMGGNEYVYRFIFAGGILYYDLGGGIYQYMGTISADTGDMVMYWNVDVESKKAECGFRDVLFCDPSEVVTGGRNFVKFTVRVQAFTTVSNINVEWFRVIGYEK